MTVAPPEPVQLHGLSWDLAGVSEQGPRSENQDALALDDFARTGIVAVADGMGGERSGRVAADTALAALLQLGPIRSLDDARRAVRVADGAVAGAAQENPGAHGGMGCALGLLSLTASTGDGLHWIGAHVGDVRIISRSPDGTVRLETRDHTPAFARWEAGEISLDEIPDTAGANRLQRAVGRGGEADATWLPARPGWAYLIVSDGVYKSMRLDELGEVMGTSPAAAGVEQIRRKVEERGPEDNYTALLVRVLGDAAPSAAPSLFPEPMSHSASTPAPRSGRSLWGVLAALLSLLALATAGYAFWTARQATRQAAERTEVQRLQTQVDTLRAQLAELRAPFGPSAAARADSLRADSLRLSPRGVPPRP